MTDAERLHTSVLVVPQAERRKLRKARRRAAEQLRYEARAREYAEQQASREAERQERRNTVYLPRAGEPGPESLRTPGRFRLPKHQDTTSTLGGQYPFLAEGGLGSAGIYIGQDLYSGAAFTFDPWELYRQGLITAPNILIVGLVGSGKSALSKSLYTRAIPFGKRVYVSGDPKGEHSKIAELVGGKAIALGRGMQSRLNPLDEGYRASGISDADWGAQVAARRRDLIGSLGETMLGRPLSPLEHTCIDQALQDVVRENATPILPQIVDRILAPGSNAPEPERLREDGRQLGHALRRLVSGDLAGVFDGPSTVKFDPSLPMISLDLSRMADSPALTPLLMTCSSAWMESALLDPRGGQRFVLDDEAWHTMSFPALLRRKDAWFRLARHYGISNIVIFHKLSDLDNLGDQGSANRAIASSLLANAETRIVLRQESDQLGPTAQALGLTGTEQALLPSLGVGQALWKIAGRSFLSQHQLHPAELQAFDTRQKMLEKT